MERQGLTSRVVAAETAAVAFATALLVAACGGSGSPPSSPGPGSSGDRINGSERLGWTQNAGDSTELGAFRYAAYIDDANRVELTEVNCSGSGPFSCSSRMPAMSPGAHTVSLVSFVLDGATVIESPKSANISLVMSGLTAPAPAASNELRAPVDVVTADGIHMRLEVVSDRFDRPTAMAAASDGRMFVAERSGTIRIVAPESLVSPSAFVMPEPAIALSEVATIGESAGGLLDLALDPQFDRTRFVYALYTTGGDAAPLRFTLARFRESGGHLGERAVLLDHLEASPSDPVGAIAIGPDGKLYAAFDDGGDPARSPMAASYSGKILRLNLDGTTPQDRPGVSPIFASDLQAPRGLEWQPKTGALWLAETANGAEELRVVAAESVRAPRADTRVRIPLPARTGVSSLTFYQHDLLPGMMGNLLIAAEEGTALLRIRFDSRTSMRILATEPLLQDLGLRLGVVATGADGGIYLTTERALLRFAPTASVR